MYTPKITHIEFKQASDRNGDCSAGRVSFVLNSCVLFEYLPVQQTDGGNLRIAFPAEMPVSLPEMVRQEVERRVLMALGNEMK